MDLGISGRTALVCGASRGLGFACAEALAAEGVAVTLVGRHAATLGEAATRIGNATGAVPRIIEADLSSEAGRRPLAEAAAQMDILVTNAGGPPSRDYTKLSADDWDRALQSNFLSAVDLIRVAAPVMAERGFGRIVNITSMTVRVPVQCLELSTASRLALTGYVAGVARQVARSGVTINNLLPGTIMTERIAELGDTAAALIAKVPAGRAGSPAEFGAACAFLCSRQAGFITGQNLLLDGGLCAITI